ncbi:MAG: sensor histidine kinase [Bacteroidales bacterium]|nr:sensor histidine kinase [Bacteroidales bacterium]
MTGHKKDLTSFILHSIELINHYKLPDLLAYICSCFHYKRGFIYQTDGFRFFYLKETFGNEDQNLPYRFSTDEMTEQHMFLAKEDPIFYVWNGKDLTPEEVEIIEFYGTHSLLIDHIKDTEGKIIGYIGFADNQKNISLDEEELKTIQHILRLISKEVVIREYKERGIRASKTLESIMNNMGVDIYVNSFDNHDMLYANESMAAPYGGWKHFEGKKCWESLYTDKIGECDFCPRKNLIDENGEPTRVYSWDYQRPFDKAWFRVFSAVFNWIDGQMAHVVTSVDITNQKNIEEQLVQAKDKAENMDRLKSAFLANMSHEIRTPLNAIIGFSGLLAEENDAEKRKRYNHFVQESNQLLLQLITDILDFSRIEAGILDFSMKNISVSELCDEIVYSYQIKEPHVPVKFHQDHTDYKIYSDKKRLMQVITNFINNALKFTTEGEIVVGYHLLNDHELEFYVKDTGMGIAPEKINQVFDRFTKLNQFAKGTGLGLSICKSIVEQLDGHIGVESRINEGSRFWFKLPYDKIQA